ncbi:hypothetical protein D3C59_37185, partial [Streptomyces sp. SHP22-7]
FLHGVAAFVVAEGGQPRHFVGCLVEPVSDGCVVVLLVVREVRVVARSWSAACWRCWAAGHRLRRLVMQGSR